MLTAATSANTLLFSFVVVDWSDSVMNAATQTAKIKQALKRT